MKDWINRKFIEFIDAVINPAFEWFYVFDEIRNCLREKDRKSKPKQYRKKLIIKRKGKKHFSCEWSINFHFMT